MSWGHGRRRLGSRNIGLAVGVGGTLFGQMALEPSVREISHADVAGRVVNDAWRSSAECNCVLWASRQVLGTPAGRSSQDGKSALRRAIWRLPKMCWLVRPWRPQLARRWRGEQDGSTAPRSQRAHEQRRRNGKQRAATGETVGAHHRHPWTGESCRRRRRHRRDHAAIDVSRQVPAVVPGEPPTSATGSISRPPRISLRSVGVPSTRSERRYSARVGDRNVVTGGTPIRPWGRESSRPE